MIQLKEVDFDGSDYYLASDADDRIDELIEEIEGKDEDYCGLQGELDAAHCDLSAQEDHEGRSKDLKALLKKAADILGNFEKQGVEVNYNGKITDISGFISDIEWEIKA